MCLRFRAEPDERRLIYMVKGTGFVPLPRVGTGFAHS